MRMLRARCAVRGLLRVRYVRNELQNAGAHAIREATVLTYILRLFALLIYSPPSAGGERLGPNITAVESKPSFFSACDPNDRKPLHPQFCPFPLQGLRFPPQFAATESYNALGSG